MNELRYVLKFNEEVLVPKNKNSLLPVLKVAIWVIIGIVVVGSFIFQDNLFNEISWTTRILFGSMGVVILFVEEKKNSSHLQLNCAFMKIVLSYIDASDFIIKK